LYKAAGDTQAETEYLAPGKLHIMAVVLDKVKKVGTIHRRAGIFNNRILRNWQKDVGVYDPVDPKIMYSPEYQALRRCLTGDIRYGLVWD
jgi:hypothetical protein